MALRFFTEDLVNSVKRRSLVPVSQTTFQDSDIIELANEELGITIVPDIQSVREDLFLAVEEITLTSGVSDYRLPKRAIGNALKSILYSNSDQSSYWEIPRIHLNRTQDQVLTGLPDSFFLKGDAVSLSPIPNGTGYLQMWHYRRPSSLVPSTQCSQITAVADLGSTVQLTVQNDLTGVLSTTTLADIFSAITPSVFKAIDVTVVSVAASIIVVDKSNVSVGGVIQVIAGDYIALEQTSNVPFVPAEYHPVLAQAVSCRLLEALGDLNKLQTGMAKLGEMRSQAMKLIMNRVETAVEFFNNPNKIGGQTGRYSRRAGLR
jgi:hypothetical protein